MNLSETNQFLLLSYGAILGIGFGIFYDILRIFKIFIVKSIIVKSVIDFIYAIICSIFAFLFFVAYTCGEIRFFLLATMLAFAILFRFTLGRLTGYIYMAAYYFLCKIFMLLHSAYLTIKIPISGLINRILNNFSKKNKKNEKQLET